MPAVTITLTDLPDGSIEIESNHKPEVGAPITPAQQVALDIVNRTRRHWGVQPPPSTGVNIDAVHFKHPTKVMERTHD